MIPFRHVADRFFNRPLCLRPETADTISALLLSRMTEARGGAAGVLDDDGGKTVQVFSPTAGPDGSVEFHSPRVSRFYGEFPKGGGGRPLPFRRTEDGTAILTLVGEWVNRGAWVGASSGLMSYEGFSFQLRCAVSDADTKAILLDLESPGGEAVGCFEAAALVRAAAAVKPVTAVVNGMAASAAYAIASGANRIVTIPTGLSGSIGVLLVHLDFSQWLKEEGIKPTLVIAGAHKADGNPYEPLSKDVREDLQAEVMGFYDQFVETVAVGRRLDPARVRDTQARVFKGDEAVAAGLADSVGSFESALSEMSSARLGRSQSGATMTTKESGTPAADTHAGISQADHDSALASATATAATSATKRIEAILQSKEAAGRAGMAQHLAFKTTMSADDAVALLGAAPKEAAAKGSRLDGLVPSPKVDNDEPARSDAQAVAAGWSSVVAQVNKELPAGPRAH